VSEDHHFMQRCLQLAQQAAESGEVPVGALIVREGSIIAEAANQPVSSCDPTAHAEVCAIRRAAIALDNYRLVGCTLYSSIEPCLMCAGAAMHARLDKIVYGASEPRAGAVSGGTNYFEQLRHLHPLEISGGLLEAESRALIQAFFRARR
jgi:tRNA(adenine34) deaminase